MADNIKLIGAGETHTTIGSWEAATNYDLVTATDREIGQLKDQEFNEIVVIAGATTNANYYRWLRSADGAEFDHTTKVDGARVTSSGAALTLLDVSEDYFHFGGSESISNGSVGLSIICTADDSAYGFFCNNSGVIFQQVVTYDCYQTNILTDGKMYGGRVGAGMHCDFWNCLFSNLNSISGSVRGLYASNQVDVTSYNCVIYNINNGSDVGRGFHNQICYNCYGDANDQAFISSTGDYNCASDTTAPGGNSLQNRAGVDQFVSVVSGVEDFHLKAGSDLINSGNDAYGNSYDIDGIIAGVRNDIGVDEYSVELSVSGDLFTRGKDNLQILYPDNVVFYHPVNDRTEHTQQLQWDKNPVAFDDGIIVSGATITASGHTEVTYDNQNNQYPTLSGATSIAVAYWGRYFYRTGPDAEVFVGDSSDLDTPANGNGLHLHGNTGKPTLHVNGVEYVAIGSLNPLPNDTEWHFTVLYAEISGGTWRIYGSVDGNALLLLGNLSATEPLDGQRYLMINLDDTTEDPLEPIIDEVVCWTGLTQPFTNSEIISLDNLARIHDRPMDENFGHFDFSNSIDLFIAVPEPSVGSKDLFIHGYAEIFTSGNLFAYGKTNFQTSGDLFVNGHVEDIASRDLFIDGFGFTSDSCNLYMNGGQNLYLYIFGHGYEINNQNLFIHGHNEISISGDLFMSGSGIIPYNNNLNFFINGVQPKPALSCPILDPTASIQITDGLISVYQSRIDALINQLGKNVYLEFDPIRDPCPNCEYDTQRKRSRGIYIPGGPRPFARGRRCPYCKGRGFTETAVNKCIKCLTKWNPRDAKDFGIAISQKGGIVRLKTYLTEADDLSRAKTVIVNHDIVSQMKLKVKLVQGPVPVGLREDRYCISFWELI